MKLLLQWTLADPTDWIEFDFTQLQQLRQLPKKALPDGTDLIDNNPGWVYAFNLQGIVFSGFDHYSARPLPPQGVEVICWNDDPEDYPDGPWAQVWQLRPLRSDPRYGGQTNTDQSLTVYTDDPAIVAFWTGQTTSGGPVTVLPWSEFVQPANNLTLHGVWVTDELAETHRARRSAHGWREWSA